MLARTQISLSVAALLAFGISFGLPTTAHATLIGDEVRLQISSIDTTFTVASGGGPDFSISSFNWNIESSSISFFIGPGAIGNLGNNLSFTISDLDWVGSPSSILIGASIVGTNDLFASATDAILTFDDQSITVDLSSFGGMSVTGLPSIDISLQTAVPEPGTALLLSLGLVGLNVVRRR